MHIELDLIAKRVASKSNLVIKKEEADWFLNKGVNNFLLRRNPDNTRKGIGFHETKKRMEEIHTLLETVNLSLYKNDSNSQFAYLPDDFYGHNRDSYISAYNCNGVVATDTTTPLYYAVVPFANLGDLFATYTVQELNPSNAVIFTLAIHTGAITEMAQGFEVVRELLYKLRLNTDLSVYWERFGDIVSPNSFIFVRKVLNGQTKIRVTNGTTSSDVNYTQLSVTRQTVSNATVVSGTGRLHQDNELDEILRYSFTSTVPVSPVSTIANGKLIVYHDSTFIFNSCILSYIRKPRPINLDLGWNCDLPEDAHSEIVLLAAEELLAYRGYQNVNAVSKMVGLKE